MVHPSRCLRLACTIFDRPDTHMSRQQATYFVSLFPTSLLLPFHVRLSLRQQTGQDMACPPVSSLPSLPQRHGMCATKKSLVSIQSHHTMENSYFGWRIYRVLALCEEQRGACLRGMERGGNEGWHAIRAANRTQIAYSSLSRPGTRGMPIINSETRWRVSIVSYDTRCACPRYSVGANESPSVSDFRLSLLPRSLFH